jgi:predicted CXXCH cytochrome family protein
MLIPGVLPGQPLDKNYPGTDLNNAFFIDDKAKAWGSHDARKHHQEYQDYIQSTHYTKNKAACHDCHSPHSVEGKKEIVARNTCDGCHKDVKYDVDKIMPGLASTAQNLFVRSHTFNAKQDRKGGPTAGGMPEPAYYYKR